VKIQVKTTRIKENSWVEWSVEKNTPADYIACVDITKDRFWLIAKEDFIDKAVSSAKNRRLWWYLPGKRPERGRRLEEESFVEDESEAAIPRIFRGATRITKKS